jgi:hypothetical protein
MRRRKFTFTITDAAIFLGKSPVTLRQWERKGVVSFDRLGSNRRLDCEGMRQLAERAYVLGRISHRRYLLVSAGLTILELIEQ